MPCEFRFLVEQSRKFHATIAHVSLLKLLPDKIRECPVPGFLLCYVLPKTFISASILIKKDQPRGLNYILRPFWLANDFTLKW
jgi:hypothetical protein